MSGDLPLSSGVDVPLVTIGIPTYERSEGLHQALGAAVRQHHSNLEIIIADNGSRDATPTVAAHWQARDSRIVYVRHPENLGAERNFASLLARASGRYFMWLADDDSIGPCYVAAAVRVLSAHPEIGFVSPTVRYWSAGQVREVEAAKALLSRSAARRVISMAAVGGRHGWYYGVGRTEVMRVPTIRQTFGGDFLYLTELSAVTLIGTMPERLDRSLGGESGHLEKLANRFGLPPRWGRHHFLWIGLKVSALILKDSDVVKKEVHWSKRPELALVVGLYYARHWFLHSVVSPSWMFYARCKGAFSELT